MCECVCVCSSHQVQPGWPGRWRAGTLKGEHATTPEVLRRTCVPTGMNTGVSMGPCGRYTVVARARPARRDTVKRRGWGDPSG